MSQILIVGEGGPPQEDNSFPLFTKKKNRVAAVILPPVPPVKLHAAVGVVTKMGKSIEVRCLSGAYNCFGMVFANRRAAVEDGAAVRRILADDEYQLIRDFRETKSGDVIVYRGKGREIVHTGIVWTVSSATVDRISARILSKWGPDWPECWHSIEEVPGHWLQETFEIWTERRANGS